MVTFPHGLAEPERRFLERQKEIKDRLRWLDPRTRRARTLAEELRLLTLNELRRESARPEPKRRERPEPWWLK